MPREVFGHGIGYHFVAGFTHPAGVPSGIAENSFGEYHGGLHIKSVSDDRMGFNVMPRKISAY